MMPSIRKTWLSALVALSAITSVTAQVHTDCDPRQKDCPADPAFGTEYFFNFNTTPPAGTWETMAGKVTYDQKQGAAFTISKKGESPTLRTKFYFFFGRTEMMMKVAPGTGIISSMMWLSDDLDEVDWEFFGTNNTYAATNYFGKGEQDFTNGGYHEVPFNVHDDYHNYTTVWTRDSLDWYIDGNLVRTLLPKDANNTRNYPQTPMRLSLGIWAGGDPDMPQGVREWAGGDTDFGAGPYTMWVKSVKVTDFTPDSKEYIYGDRSGSMESIQVVTGNSTVKEALFPIPKETFAEKWDKLPSTAKTAIYASGAGLGAVILAFGLWYCIRQRRRGAREAKAAALQAEQDRLELQGFKTRGVNPDGFSNGNNDWTVAEVHDNGVVQEKRPEYVVHERPLDSPSSGGIPPPLVFGNQQPGGNDWNTRGGPASPRSPPLQSPMGGMHAVPLLQERSNSPRVGSPGPQRTYSPAPARAFSPAPQRAFSPVPQRAFSPAPSQFDNGMHHGGYDNGMHHAGGIPQRSATLSGAFGGDGGYQGGFDDPRAQSPAHVMPPQRSGSAAPTYGQGYGAPQGQGYAQQGGYWNNNGPGGFR